MIVIVLRYHDMFCFVFGCTGSSLLLGLSLVAVCSLLLAVASLVVEPGL